MQLAVLQGPLASVIPVPLPSALFVLALGGHFAFWIMLFNRLHARAWPCRVINLSEKVLMLLAVVIPCLAAAVLWPVGMGASTFVAGYRRVFMVLFWSPLSMTEYLLSGYAWASILVAGIKLLRWIPLRLSDKQTVVAPQTTSGESSYPRIVVAKQVLTEPLTAGSLAGRIARLPGNQTLQLEVNHKKLIVPRLPSLLEGLTIGHLSDLHFTGDIKRPFFELAMRELKELRCDLVALTGDVIDVPECLPWIGDILGSLEMPGRAFCILGNHDRKVGDESCGPAGVSVEEIRGALEAAGWIDLGGRATMIDLRNVRLLLAGNERPWFPGLPQSMPRQGSGANVLRILLSHTPDQFYWAVEQQYDLVLAGHTHGGQISFPLWGPMVVPSRYGVRFAGGTFQQEQTVMHVTRGIAGLHPLRFNCRPELTRLELTCK